MIDGDCDKKDFALSCHFVSKSFRWHFLAFVWYYREIPEFTDILYKKNAIDADRARYFKLLKEARSEKWLDKSERERWEMLEVEDGKRIKERKAKAKCKAKCKANTEKPEVVRT